MRDALEPRISAIIPAYNRERTLARALDSVLEQSVAAGEVLVVDDGSTDATRDVVTGYGDRVRCIAQSNAGASAARNRGVREATHAWVAFLDSDDYWAPDHLERMTAAIRQTAGAADCYFSDIHLPPDQGGGRLWSVCGFEPSEPIELTADASTWAMLPIQPMMLQSSGFHRESFLALGGLAETLVTREDTHLFLLLGLGGSACAVAGCSTQMTSDESPEARLTLRFDGGSEVYWESTRWLYQDVLRRRTEITRGAKRELTRRLAAAHLRLARFAWRAGRRGECFDQLRRALTIDPGILASRLGGRLRRKSSPDS